MATIQQHWPLPTFAFFYCSTYLTIKFAVSMSCAQLGVEAVAQSLCELLQQPGSAAALRCALQAKEVRREATNMDFKDGGFPVCL